LDLSEIQLLPVNRQDECQFQELMHKHHYLGRLPKISETIWYTAIWRGQWIALLTFSASAWKCSARDQWIGWSARHQYGRLKLVINNSRFLILPDWHIPNLGSRVLSLCHKRLPTDWQKTFGHPVLLLETFVDPLYFHGTVYKAANWLYLGDTKGFRRNGKGYSDKPHSPKMVFVKQLRPDAQKLLAQPILDPIYRTGGNKVMLNADQMHSLPYFFSEIPDPRRTQGRRHRLATVLAIAAGAILCGARGYKAISDWADSLGAKARERFGCRREKDSFVVPSEYILRDILIRVDPAHLDSALQRWNEAYAVHDDSLAIDGKTMCNAINEQGHRTHIMSAIGHQSKIC
jgi:hypothetical protein